MENFIYKNTECYDCYVKDMKIAQLKELLTEWANATFKVGNDGLWYYEHLFNSAFERELVNKLNKILI